MVGVVPSPLSALGRLTPLTGFWPRAFFSQRYSNSDDRAASRFRRVGPSSPRRSRSSRQAMTCARVTMRNSSGRTMPVKRMKSPTAILDAFGAWVADVCEPLDLRGDLGEPLKLGGGQQPLGRD